MSGAGATTSGAPDLDYAPKIYWAFAGGAIAFATAINIFYKILYWQRSALNRPHLVEEV